MSGSLSQTCTAPIDPLFICPSVTGSQFWPPSVVFQRPPPVVPMKYSNGRASEPATAMDRPPRGGPTLRHSREPQKSSAKASWARAGEGVKAAAERMLALRVKKSAKLR